MTATNVESVVITSEEDIENFLSGPVTSERLKKLNLKDLKSIAEYLELSLSSNPTKAKIIGKIVSSQGSSNTMLMEIEKEKIKLQQQQFAMQQQQLAMQQEAEKAKQ